MFRDSGDPRARDHCLDCILWQGWALGNDPRAEFPESLTYLNSDTGPGARPPGGARGTLGKGVAHVGRQRWKRGWVEKTRALARELLNDWDTF